jgi:hypothetical protein
MMQAKNTAINNLSTPIHKNLLFPLIPLLLTPPTVLSILCAIFTLLL